MQRCQWRFILRECPLFFHNLECLWLARCALCHSVGLHYSKKGSFALSIRYDAMPREPISIGDLYVHLFWFKKRFILLLHFTWKPNPPFINVSLAFLLHTPSCLYTFEVLVLKAPLSLSLNVISEIWLLLHCAEALQHALCGAEQMLSVYNCNVCTIQFKKKIIYLCQNDSGVSIAVGK